MFTEHFKYCLDQLRRFDHDRYLAILMTPEKLRAPLCALYAFDVEMTRIPYAVSEPMLGEIRFQWWRETLEALTPAAMPGHEIACALAETLFDGPLSPIELISLIDARARGLSETPAETLSELLGDISAGDARCQDLALRITGEEAGSRPSPENARNLVLAYGLVGQVRELPHAASRQQLSLPLDLMARHEIDPHDVFAGTHRPGIAAAVHEMLDLASELYGQGKLESFRGLPGRMAVLLPASLTPLYLQKLRRRDFDPFQHSSELPAFRRQIRYLRVRWRQSF